MPFCNTLQSYVQLPPAGGSTGVDRPGAGQQRQQNYQEEHADPEGDAPVLLGPGRHNHNNNNNKHYNSNTNTTNTNHNSTDNNTDNNNNACNNDSNNNTQS